MDNNSKLGKIANIDEHDLCDVLERMGEIVEYLATDMGKPSPLRDHIDKLLTDDTLTDENGYYKGYALSLGLATLGFGVAHLLSRLHPKEFIKAMGQEVLESETNPILKSMKPTPEC